LKISCPSPKKVKITFALWGRLNNSICCTVPSQCSQCRHYVTSLAQGYCQSTSSCTIQASNAPFYMDPCPGQSKYLQVDYTCV
jgi:hypothetical protein